MKLSQIPTRESLREELGGDQQDSGDHEYRGDFHSAVEATENTAELESDANDIDDLVTGIEDAASGVEKIDEIQSNLSEGSVSTLEMRSVQIAHASIMRSLGISASVSTMESAPYGSRGQALTATLEADKQSILQRIAAGFKIAVDKILSFIQNLLRNTWALTKYLDYVKKKSASVKGQKPSKPVMSESARALSADGKANDDSINKLNKTADEMIATSLEAVNRLNGLDFKFGGEVDQRLNATLALGNLPERNGGSSAEVRGYLTGDRAFSIARKSFEGQSSAFTHAHQAHEPAKEIAVASPEEITRVLKMAESIIKGIKDIDGKKQVLKGLVSRIAQFAAQFAAEGVGNFSKAGRQKSYELGAIRGSQEYMRSILGRLPLEAFKTAKAFIDYARHSLAYYSVEK